MTITDSPSASRNNILAALIYYLVSLLLLPVTVIGYILWVGRLYAGRKSGISATTQGPLSARWFQHRLGTRRDEPAYRMLTALPGLSPFTVNLVFGPMLLAHRLSGYVPPTFRYPFEGEITLQNQASARQTVYDSVVERFLPGLPQFVILGAGFDTRALRLRLEMQVRCFELDTAETLRIKQQVLQRAGVDTSRVTFVPADFEKDDWLGKLVEAGFDPGKPALFLWEGVTPYLERAAVESTLRKVAGTARESVIAFDFFTTEVLEGQSLSLRLVRASLNAGGEPLKFGIDATPPVSDRLAELLQACGLSLLEQRTVGKETEDKRAWGGFAVAAVK